MPPYQSTESRGGAVIPLKDFQSWKRSHCDTPLSDCVVSGNRYSMVFPAGALQLPSLVAKTV
jgi:hypothetical protein